MPPIMKKAIALQHPLQWYCCLQALAEVATIREGHHDVQGTILGNTFRFEHLRCSGKRCRKMQNADHNDCRITRHFGQGVAMSRVA